MPHLTAPLAKVPPVHIETPGPGPIPGAPHLLLLNIEPVVAVQQDGLGAQSSLHTGGVLKYNESEVGNLESSFSVTSSARGVPALLLVDPDLKHSAELREEVAEVILSAAMGHVANKQLLAVATKGKILGLWRDSVNSEVIYSPILGGVLLLAEPLWPLAGLWLLAR